MFTDADFGRRIPEQNGGRIFESAPQSRPISHPIRSDMTTVFLSGAPEDIARRQQRERIMGIVEIMEDARKKFEAMSAVDRALMIADQAASFARSCVTVKSPEADAVAAAVIAKNPFLVLAAEVRRLRAKREQLVDVAKLDAALARAQRP
jgi:hypothetical protein